MYSPKKLIENLEPYLEQSDDSIIKRYKEALEKLDGNVELTAENIRSGLELAEHEEGGFFREFIRTKDYTVIFYLLPENNVSSWHCLKDTEETFKLISGDALTIPKIGADNIWISEESVTYSNDIIIKKCENDFGDWFGAYHKGEYALVTCTCEGPFDYKKFKMAKKNDLDKFLKKNPGEEFKQIIEHLKPKALKKNNNLIRSIIQFLSCCITKKKNGEQTPLISKFTNTNL